MKLYIISIYIPFLLWIGCTPEMNESKLKDSSRLNPQAFQTRNTDSVPVVNNTETLDSASTSNTYISNVYEAGHIKINLKEDGEGLWILLSVGNFNKEYDLNQLGVPTKMQPEVIWSNNEYACLLMWWSQAQSRHIFVPTNRNNPFIYIDKDIEQMDSIHNNIVYIDSIYDSSNQVVFKAENLLTRKYKVLTMKIDENNGFYPFYDTIILSKDRLEVKTNTEAKSISITDIKLK